jgi:hypothetical protein
MAFRAKLTAQRGKPELWQIALAPGSAEAQADTISINMDIGAMAKGDAIILLEDMLIKIQNGKWPPL